MSPRLLDLLHPRQAYAVPLRDQSLRSGGIKSDLVSLFGSEFGATPTTHIHKVCHRLKMIWIAAGALTAQMVKFKTFGDFAVLQDPRHTMWFPATGTAIPRVILGTVPDPTRGRVAAVCDCVEMVSPEPAHLPAWVVSVNEPLLLPLHDPSVGMGLRSNRRGLTAPAFAEFRRLFSHVGLLHRLTSGGRRSLRRPPHSIRCGA